MVKPTGATLFVLRAADMVPLCVWQDTRAPWGARLLCDAQP
jgi:hypothetical protein